MAVSLSFQIRSLILSMATPPFGNAGQWSGWLGRTKFALSNIMVSGTRWIPCVIRASWRSNGRQGAQHGSVGNEERILEREACAGNRAHGLQRRLGFSRAQPSRCERSRARIGAERGPPGIIFGIRSEEHTSELQSHLNLV